MAYADDIRTIERNADVLLNACKDIVLAVNIGKTKYMEIGRHRGIIARPLGCGWGSRPPDMEVSCEYIE